MFNKILDIFFSPSPEYAQEIWTRISICLFQWLCLYIVKYSRVGPEVKLLTKLQNSLKKSFRKRQLNVSQGCMAVFVINKKDIITFYINVTVSKREKYFFQCTCFALWLIMTIMGVMNAINKSFVYVFGESPCPSELTVFKN